MGVAVERLVPAMIAGVCVVALAAALTLQYGFGLEPCSLCKIERVPYLVAALLAAAALTWQGRTRVLVGGCAVVFAVGAAIAFYHVGVEGHWWISATCDAGSDSTAPMTLADIKRALSKPAEVPCDQVQWSLLGISLTGYNMLLSLLLAAMCAGASMNVKWWRTP